MAYRLGEFKSPIPDFTGLICQEWCRYRTPREHGPYNTILIAGNEETDTNQSVFFSASLDFMSSERHEKELGGDIINGSE
jgi:hypothetical protein